MSDVRFEIQLRWSGTGRAGAGQILTDDLELELSAPGRWVAAASTQIPEKLLVSAASSCYTATLFGVLDRAKLPVDSLVVEASGNVTGLPGRPRFADIVVTPTILGGDTLVERDSQKRRPAEHTVAASSAAPSRPT